ncbi:MAG: hypothetical protein ACLP6G_21390 [Terriglobales bacterium]
MGFEQATIKVEKEKEYEELKSAVSHAFSLGRIEEFLKRVNREGVRVRDWDSVLAKRILEQVAEEQGSAAQGLYKALPVSDQAQMREFYLSRVEEVDPRLRTKFQKLFRYY